MSVEIVLSLVIAICTVFYTVINLMLWFESRESRKQKITPHVIAFLKSAENHMTLELHIKNIGEGIAENVKIKTLKDYNQFGKEGLLISELGIMKNGFNSFPPQYELKYYLHSLTEIYDKEKDESIKLELSYRSSDKRKFTQIFELPFKQLLGQNYSNPPETFMGQIPYYLDEINSTLKSIKKD
jgi:PHP family Zn ribbon phosphoesterase